MVELVKIVGKNAYTDTLIMSDGFDIKHNAILKLVLKYKDRLERKGTLSREIQKSGGRPTSFYLLNENQAIFIASLMRNSDKVVDFKDQLSDQFVKMKNFLIDLANHERLEKRESGKLTHNEKTDIIKVFVEYATDQGSKSSKMYYVNLAKMENKALFFIGEKYQNVRDVMTRQQLSVVETADQIVAKSLKDGMAGELFYKDIYKLAKKNVLSMSELVGKTLVPMFNQEQIK